MHLSLTVQNYSQSTNLPNSGQLRKWVLAALDERYFADAAELCIRIVENEEMRALNLTYRKKQNSTNVLSFPADLPPSIELPILGDIVLCAPVIAHEAVLQNKNLEAHWAHLVIHGTLHLLGFDHIDPREAEAMESQEITVMQKLGYANPYGGQISNE